MLGALLMAIGHVVLGASEIHPSFLYLSPGDYRLRLWSV